MNNQTYKPTAAEQRELDQINQTLADRGVHRSGDQFEQMAGMYAILAEMGVDPAANGLAPKPGGQMVADLVSFLQISKAELTDPSRFWPTIEARLRRWASEVPKMKTPTPLSVAEIVAAYTVDRTTVTRFCNQHADDPGISKTANAWTMTPKAITTAGWSRRTVQEKPHPKETKPSKTKATKCDRCGDTSYKSRPMSPCDCGGFYKPDKR